MVIQYPSYRRVQGVHGTPVPLISVSRGVYGTPVPPIKAHPGVFMVFQHP